MQLTPEDELILLCSQIKIHPDKQNRVKELLVLDLKWEKILPFVFSGGLAPLMYHSLKDLKERVVLPFGIIKQLKDCYFQNIARNTYHCEELRRIHRSFVAEGIDVVILKGLALADIVYRNIGLRVFNDLDILVKKVDLSAAEKIMGRLDYRADYSEMVIDHYKKNHHHLAPFFHPSKGTIVEVHSNISPYVDFDIDECWENAKETKFNGFNALVFRPEDMIIHLCLHLFSSGNTGNTLRGICDIAETLNFYSVELDWNLIQKQAEKYNITKELNSIIYVAQQFYGKPDEFSGVINPKKVDFFLVSMIKKMAFSHDKAITFPGSLLKAMAAESFSKKYEILKNKIFPDRNTMSMLNNTPINSINFYFSYLMRFIYLSNRYSKFLFITLFNTIRQIYPLNSRSSRKI